MPVPWLPLVAALLLPGQDVAAHRARVAELLAAPRAEDAAWRATLFQSVSRLEHEPVAVALPAWQSLATSGADADRANLLLYQRRHELPLETPRLDEGVDALLERALSAWGSVRLGAAQELLEAAAARAPGDARVVGNLDWLLRRPPDALSALADPRAAAHAVLAARGALP
jgi:hypothetical protein